MFFFIPTGSEAEKSRQPAVTIGIAVVCVAVFAITNIETPASERGRNSDEVNAFIDEHPWVLTGNIDDEVSSVQYRGDRAALNQLLMQSEDARLERKLSLVPSRGFVQAGWVTSLFVHFGLMHLLGNLLFLWIVGPLLEEAWGRWRFLAFYLAAGLVAGLAQFAMDTETFVAIGGASGAIAGCMGAFAVRFATTRIRFHYFAWFFFRIFMGSTWVPAWVCGGLWFALELWDLILGGAPGVATGAHVGGFVLGGGVAFAMRGLGYHRDLLTVAEAGAVEEAWKARVNEARASLARDELEHARTLLVSLLQERPDDGDLVLLTGECDVRTGRGQIRLERGLRKLLTNPDTTLELMVARLQDSLDPRAFSPSFAWQLVERLDTRKHFVKPEFVEGLLKAVAASSGPDAKRAVARLQMHRATPVVVAPPVDLAAPVSDERVAHVQGTGPEGLELMVDGFVQRVPFGDIGAVHAGTIPDGERRVLLVDLVLRVPGSPVLRLNGADPVVPTLYPSEATPAAWKAFLSGLRGAARLNVPSTPWQMFTSQDAFSAARPAASRP